MKPSFHTRILNGPFEDPCLYVRVLREGRALMFDLGFTTGLSARDILKTTDIFVSHTHMDHFIGLDNVLRVCLKKEGGLNLYGPEGFIDHVEGKLGSYTWNLSEDYPFTVHVSEVTGTSVKKADFRAENSFRREDLGKKHFGGILVRDSFYSIAAVILDHQVPCLAFSLQENFHINIDKARLDRLNLPVGPWLTGFKQLIRRNVSDAVFTIGQETYRLSDLKDIAKITKGQKISYVVDALGSEENIEKITELVKGSDELYIEAYFLHRDKARAKERYHLTAKEAGRIARDAGVGRLRLLHFSPRYMETPKTLIKEAEEEFRR